MISEYKLQETHRKSETVRYRDISGVFQSILCTVSNNEKTVSFLEQPQSFCLFGFFFFSENSRRVRILYTIISIHYPL